MVSGLAASGKSTLGRALATALGLPLVDKDDFLEALFGEHDVVDAETRSALSRRADDMFIERARASEAAVLVSFWRRDELSSGSGTPTDWFDDLDNVVEVVEVHCACDPQVAVERFLSRRRHPGHGDERWDPVVARARFAELAAFGPLGIGRVITVDTAVPVDVDQLAETINRPER